MLFEPCVRPYIVRQLDALTDIKKAFVASIMTTDVSRCDEKNTNKTHVLNLFDNNILFKPNTVEEMVYVGFYYALRNNFCEMIKHYVEASAKNYDDATFRLGYYYQIIDIDYDKMKNYYNILVKKGNESALVNMAEYYTNVERNYNKALEYYQLAINKGSIMALSCLAHFYKKLGNDKLTEKYLIRSCEEGHNTYDMNNLAAFYGERERYQEMKKYLIGALINHTCGAIDNVYLLYSKYTTDEETPELLDIIKTLMTFEPRIYYRKGIVVLFNLISTKLLNEDDRVALIYLLMCFDFEEDDHLFPSLKSLLEAMATQLEIIKGQCK